MTSGQLEGLDAHLRHFTRVAVVAWGLVFVAQVALFVAVLVKL